MKTFRGLLGLFAVLLTLGGAVAVPIVWQRLHTLYPTPETESAFLKAYTPQPLIEQYKCNEPAVYSGPNGGGSAGEKFVTRTGRFDFFFVMRSEKRLPLIIALNNDAYDQLILKGAQILNRSGDPHSGFQYDYKLDKSIGSLVIAPLETLTTSPIHRSYPLPNGTVDVSVHIEEREMWFPKEPPLPNADQLQELHAVATGRVSY
jgi:hypothetical protein